MTKERRILESALLMTLLLWAAGERLLQSRVSALAARFTSTTESLVLKKDLLLDGLKTPADILFLGDSTMNAAIDDDLFYKTGKRWRSLNLGLVGDLVTYGDYWALRKYLSRMPPPKAIVIWHTVDVWPRNLDLSLFYFTRPDTPDQSQALINSVGHLHINLALLHWPVKVLSQILEGQLYKISNLYRYRIWVKKIIAEKIPALDPVGLMGTYPKPLGAVEHRVQAELAAFRSMDLYISKDNQYWFKRCLDLANAHSVSVFVSRSPINGDFMTDTIVREKVAKQNSDLKKLLSQFISVVDLMETNPVLPSDCFNDDKDHVNLHGKEVLTSIYAKRLDPYLTK